MKCITSPSLDDTQIVSYIEGEADDIVVAHISNCPFCSEKAKRWARLQNRLRKELYRVACPTPLELGDYHLGLLPSGQKLLVAQHLRECIFCKREVAELQGFLEEPIPGSRIRKAARVMIARFAKGQTEPGMLENTSVTQVSMHALRGEAKGPITLKADGLVIVLDLQLDQTGKVNILGQLAADSAEEQDQWTGAFAELRKEENLEFSSILDDVGGFEFKGIVLGSKELQITTRDNSLTVVANFEVSI